MTSLLLLPGLVCDQAVWDPVLPVLQRSAECRVFSYGSLDSIAAMADQVLASAPPRFCLAGHSMGGRVALEIMRRAADRVERLALLDTGFQARSTGTAGDAERTQRQALLDLARREGMRTMGKEWLSGMVHPARFSDTVLTNAIADMVARHSAETFAAQIKALLERPDATDVLRSLGCPTLIACGRQDAWSPLSRHEEMARLAAKASLVVFEDCGHMAMMEQPPRVGAALAAWLTAT